MLGSAGGDGRLLKDPTDLFAVCLLACFDFIVKAFLSSASMSSSHLNALRRRGLTSNPSSHSSSDDMKSMVITGPNLFFWPSVSEDLFCKAF